MELRDSAVGRQAYLVGRRLAVWQVVALTRDFGGDAERTAAHLELPKVFVAAALAYARAYPEEVEAAIADSHAAAAHLTERSPRRAEPDGTS